MLKVLISLILLSAIVFAQVQVGQDVSQNFGVVITSPEGPATFNTNVTTNASNFWITTDFGALNAVSQIPHNSLLGLQGGVSGEFYHINASISAELEARVFQYITSASLFGIHDQSLNTTNNVTFLALNLSCGSQFNQSCLNVSGDITVRDIYARSGFFSNNSIFIGDSIRLSASGIGGNILNITGGNISVENYFGSGEFLTDLNLSGISFEGDTINATNFNGGFFNGVFNWTATFPWLSFNGSNLEFNETHLIQEAEVVVRTEVINIVSAGGVGSAITSLLDFEITQITVNTTAGTMFRFEATETSTGNFIDKNRMLHNTLWDIEKSFAINDTVTLDITSANPDDTFTVTIKYLDNFT